MNQHQPPISTNACLCILLASGPRNSREVLAAMADWQFTPKQVRRARERQGILIERAGSGSTMHSIWRLPDRTADGVDPIPPSAGHIAEVSPVDSGTQPATDMQHVTGMHQPAPAVPDGERRRRHARVRAFMARGLDTGTAEQVADALASRDRNGLHAMGSCAECQNVELLRCPVTPRPVIEVHQCWYRRQCTP